jgi:hypothetical protein
MASTFLSSKGGAACEQIAPAPAPTASAFFRSRGHKWLKHVHDAHSLQVKTYIVAWAVASNSPNVFAVHVGLGIKRFGKCRKLAQLGAEKTLRHYLTQQEALLGEERRGEEARRGLDVRRLLSGFLCEPSVPL